MADRPSLLPARLVLLVGVLLGLAGIEDTLTRRPHLVGVDLQVYYVAAEAAVAGGDFYAVSPAGHPYSYVYPPVTIPAFFPYAALDSWQAAFAVHTFVNVAAAVGVAGLLVRFTERYRADTLQWIDRGLIGAFVVFSYHSFPSILFGETNFPLLLALVAGFWWLDAGEETRAGVAFALPAVLKLFPAFVGLWLVGRRAWRAIAAATATGVGLLGTGVLVFGIEAHLTWLRTALVPRLSSEEFAGGLAPGAQLVTLRRPLSVVFPDLPPTAYGLLAFALLAPVLAYCYRRAGTPVERLVGVFATMAAMVVGFPSLLVYVVFLFFPMVPLCYLLSGAGRRLFLAGAFVANFAFTAPEVERLVVETPVPDWTFTLVEPALALATPALYGTILMLAGSWVFLRRTAPTPAAPS